LQGYTKEGPWSAEGGPAGGGGFGRGNTGACGRVRAYPDGQEPTIRRSCDRDRWEGEIGSG